MKVNTECQSYRHGEFTCKDGFDYIEGCFNAAFAEGLYEVLQETTDERLKDLVERRLMYAYYFIKDGSKVE